MFSEEELEQAVQDVHRAGARAYLTLNIDLAERELELAARVLERSQRAGVDAVLVRDPAFLALRDAYLVDHAQRLARLAMAVTGAMELDNEIRTTVELSAYLSQRVHEHPAIHPGTSGAGQQFEGLLDGGRRHCSSLRKRHVLRFSSEVLLV